MSEGERAQLGMVPSLDAFRTLPCRKYTASGWCPYGRKCTFIHDRRLVSFALHPRGCVSLASKPRRRSPPPPPSDAQGGGGGDAHGGGGVNTTLEWLHAHVDEGRPSLLPVGPSLECTTLGGFKPGGPLCVDLATRAIAWHTLNPSGALSATKLEEAVEALVWSSTVAAFEDRLAARRAAADAAGLGFPVELCARDDDAAAGTGPAATLVPISEASLRTVRPAQSRLHVWLGRSQEVRGSALLRARPSPLLFRSEPSESTAPAAAGATAIPARRPRRAPPPGGEPCRRSRRARWRAPVVRSPALAPLGATRRRRRATPFVTRVRPGWHCPLLSHRLGARRFVFPTESTGSVSD